MKINVPEGLKNLAAIVIALGVLFGFNQAYKSDVISTAKAATKDIDKRQDDMEKKLNDHIDDEKLSNLELQKDVRELYRAMINRQPSPRLEGPPTLAGDAGLLPDGGR